MLWDEDLRDKDSKSDKIGSGKDGGRYKMSIIRDLDAKSNIVGSGEDGGR